MDSRALGADDARALFTEGLLVATLPNLGEYSEAEALDRESLAKHGRVYGRDHRAAITTSANLAPSLTQQGKQDEAAFPLPVNE